MPIGVVPAGLLLSLYVIDIFSWHYRDCGRYALVDKYHLMNGIICSC